MFSLILTLFYIFIYNIIEKVHRLYLFYVHFFTFDLVFICNLPPIFDRIIALNATFVYFKFYTKNNTPKA